MKKYIEKFLKIFWLQFIDTNALLVYSDKIILKQNEYKFIKINADFLVSWEELVVSNQEYLEKQIKNQLKKWLCDEIYNKLKDKIVIKEEKCPWNWDIRYTARVKLFL